MHISTIDYNTISRFLFDNFDSETPEKIFEIFFKFYF